MKFKYHFSIKVFLFISIICSLQSCSLLSMMVDEEFHKISDTLDLTLKNNELTFPVTINDRATSLYFDTGSEGPLLYDDNALNNKKSKKISKFGSVNNFGNKLDFYRTPLSLETELFKSNNTVFVVLPNFYAINKCSKREVTGIFYGKYFKDKILNINFEQGKLFIIDSLKNRTYTEIESKFFGLTQVKIKLKVNGKSEWFDFDTGNVLHPMILNQKSEIIQNIKYDYNVRSNSLGLVEKLNSTYFYENLKISFGDDRVDSYAVTNDGFNKYKHNNVGIQFIKNYNWIIDYKNKKVYYKSYKKSEINSIKVTKDHLNVCAVEEGKLVIVQTFDQTGSPSYKLGVQIISVNNVPITSKNICSYLKLLNKTDWNILDIETQ